MAVHGHFALDEEEWRTVVAYSHAHIMMVDEAIGRVLDTLERLGLRESTTVVFVADHGDMEGGHNRFDKGAYFYEEVWRIPLIISRPDRGQATQDAYVSLIDVGETLFGLIDAAATAERPRAGGICCRWWARARALTIGRKRRTASTISTTA